MRLAAVIVLVLLVAVPASAAREAWEGTGRGQIQWTSGDCPATAVIEMERNPTGWDSWRITLDIVQDAAVVDLAYICLPGAKTITYPQVNGNDRQGWRVESRGACGFTRLELSFPLPNVHDAVPARVVEMEYDSVGACDPNGIPRATAAMVLATPDPI